ncbi:MAG: hypothetical protein QF570_01885 [Myxococcota bacterium]|jgi:hypothetical protein|nr:hypothetical protein [Myxococcota bacterium]
MSSYADAVAAFSLVNSLGFFAAIAETEVRCALVDNRAVVVSIMFVVQLIYVAAVITLRRVETNLRGDLEASAAVDRFRRNWHRARVSFASVTAFGLALFAWIVLDGDSCRGLVP